MTRFQFMSTLVVMGIMSLAGSFIAATVLQSDVQAQAGDDDVVVCKEFQLKDKKGNLRALMKIDNSNGNLLFTMLDKNEKPRITQSVHNNGETAMIITDNKGRSRMALTSSATQPGAFSVFDSSGKIAASLAVGEGDFPMLSLDATKGGIKLGLKSDGTGVLTMAAMQGEGEEAENADYFSVVGGAGAASALLLQNQAGKASVQVQAENDGTMIFSMRENKQMRCFVSTGKDVTTAFQLDNGSGSKVYLQAQKSGTALLQLNGGENFVRSMSNADGTAECAIIKKKSYMWKATDEKAK